MPKKGKPQRPIASVSVRDKQFQRLMPTQKRVGQSDHPVAVIIDLRAGSLESLDAYLKKHRGIPDREVALELRKLISGSSARSLYRLIVVDHPDAPPSKGGRPKARRMLPTRKEIEIVEEYRKQLSKIGKTEEARLQTAGELHLSESTVHRAIKKVEAAEERAKLTNNALARRELALAELRRKR